MNCPVRAMQPCAQTECAWFIHLRGHNPNTGKEVDEWGCAMAWLPILLVENAQQSRQAGAAIESLRNNVVAIETHRIQQQSQAALPPPKSTKRR